MSLNTICIGTAQFGLNYGIANKTGKVGYETALQIIESAIENNIVFFDTAQAYGDSEELLGRVFRELEVTNKIKVTTKLQPDFQFIDVNNLESVVRGSLDRLKVNSIDSLLLHRSKIVGDWSKFIDAISKIIEKGLIKKFGISIYDPSEVTGHLSNDIISVIQFPFNCFDKRWIEQGMITSLIDNNKELMIRSIYLQGLMFLEKKDLINKKMEWADQYLHLLSQFTTKEKISKEQFAYQSVASVINQAKIIFGIESILQLHKNIEVVSSTPIRPEIINKWWNELPILPDYFLNPSKWSVRST